MSWDQSIWVLGKLLSWADPSAPAAAAICGRWSPCHVVPALGWGLFLLSVSRQPQQGESQDRVLSDYQLTEQSSIIPNGMPVLTLPGRGRSVVTWGWLSAQGHSQ